MPDCVARALPDCSAYSRHCTRHNTYPMKSYLIQEIMKQPEARRNWGLNFRRRHAAARAESPNALHLELRHAIKMMKLEVVGYEYEIGPDLWMDAAVKLPGGRIGYIDFITHPSGQWKEKHRRTQARKKALLGNTPVLWLKVRSAAEIEVEMYKWLRKL